MSSEGAGYLNSPRREQLKPENILRLLKHLAPKAFTSSSAEEEEEEEERSTLLLQHLEWEPAALIPIWRATDAPVFDYRRSCCHEF